MLRNKEVVEAFYSSNLHPGLEDVTEEKIKYKSFTGTDKAEVNVVKTKVLQLLLF